MIPSDSEEERPADNTVDVSIPVLYDAGVALSRCLTSHPALTHLQGRRVSPSPCCALFLRRESNINFLVAEASTPVRTAVQTLDDIGPEFNFTVKVSPAIRAPAVHRPRWSGCGGE